MVSSVKILGVNIINCDYNDLLALMDGAVNGNEKLMVSYANSNSLNISYKNKNFNNILNSDFTIHPDGAGVFFSSRLLGKNKKLKSRFTGSDFYPVLTNHAISLRWRIFFFGNEESVLNKIRLYYPGLNICGFNEGYNFDSEKVIEKINSSKPDVLIVGLGQPLQEVFLAKHKHELQCKAILAVGDGIKVFAGEKKRGPVFLQKAGLEWTIRLFFNPVKYWKRYIIGNPLFLYRIIRSKFTKLNS